MMRQTGKKVQYHNKLLWHYHFWGVWANPFKMHMYIPCQARFSWLCTCVRLPTVCTAFPWWCIWNQWTDLKDWCWGGHHFKRYRKSFWPSLYCLPRDHNIVRGGLSCTSPVNQWKLGLEKKIAFSESENVEAL